MNALRAQVRRAGGVNLLWGLLLQDINAQVRFGGCPGSPGVALMLGWRTGARE